MKNQNVTLKNATILVTGAAGFICSNLVLELLRTTEPVHIIGIDNMNDYYDVSIKEWRLEEIEKCLKEHSDSSYVFYKDDLANKAFEDQCTTANPRLPLVSELKKILIDAYYGFDL